MYTEMPLEPHLLMLALSGIPVTIQSSEGGDGVAGGVGVVSTQ